MREDMKQQFIFFSGGTEELWELIGISEKKFWEYMSADDWDYALIFDGHIPQEKLENNFDCLLNGCCDNKWVYFPEQNKTVGIAYHS